MNLEFFNSVFPELIRKNMKLDLFFETKSNLTRDEISLLKDACVLGIQPGIESLSDNILRLMRKGVTGLQNVFLLKTCLEMGISVAWNWIWGFPNEETLEYERMKEWVPLLNHLQPPQSFGSIVLKRFSPLFESQNLYGICRVRPSLPYRLIYDLDDKTLYDLAFYFDFEYEDGRDPRDYTAGLVDELANWRKSWSIPVHAPILTMLDLKLYIVIHDTRSCASTRVVILSGLEAKIYRWLRNIREYRVLVKHFTEDGFGAGDISEAISSLERRKLILMDGERCLALATDATTAPAEWSPQRIATNSQSISPPQLAK